MSTNLKSQPGILFEKKIIKNSIDFCNTAKSFKLFETLCIRRLKFEIISKH